ncbi:MAG: hypothetical protein WCG29_03460 [Desulfomonile sp.]|jgi:hypothetical protein|nr:hypothetical protein [Deltaproteobacteria bacterium]
MQIPWDNLVHVQNFFQLNFLFSGLEVSSNTLLLARLSAFLVFGGGLIWGAFKIVVKILDCVQAFLAGLGSLPKSFFLLLLLVIPISSDSLGAKWTGYILLVMSLFGLAASGALALVLWKYGVDQALRLIKSLRFQHQEEPAIRPVNTALPPDNIVRPLMDPPVMRSDGKPSSWPIAG